MELIEKGQAIHGRDSRKARRYKEMLAAAGFVNVHDTVIPLPWGTWSDEPKLRNVGMYFMAGFNERVVEGWSIKTLMAAGLSDQEVREMVKGVVKDIKDDSIHAISPYHVVYDQKPKL